VGEFDKYGKCCDPWRYSSDEKERKKEKYKIKDPTETREIRYTNLSSFIYHHQHPPLEKLCNTKEGTLET